MKLWMRVPYMVLVVALMFALLICGGQGSSDSEDEDVSFAVTNLEKTLPSA